MKIFLHIFVATFIKLSFYIYDGELGTSTKENMDVAYYSMQFNCRFFLFEDIELDKKEIEIESISETELKITKMGVFEITVTVANAKQSGYVISYLDRNLKKYGKILRFACISS